MTYTQKHNRDGFTLIEILIAMAIIAILTAIVAPNLMRFVRKGGKTAATATLKTFKMSIREFKSDTGQYPRSLKDLIKRPTYDEAITKKWDGPYIEQTSIQNDPWKNRYQYKVTPGQKHPYELYSYGSDDGRSTPKDQWISAWDE